MVSVGVIDEFVEYQRLQLKLAAQMGKVQQAKVEEAAAHKAFAETEHSRVVAEEIGRQMEKRLWSLRETVSDEVFWAYTNAVEKAKKEKRDE